MMPFYNGNVPIGGLKMVLLYANRLVDDGYVVKIVYPYRSNKNLSESVWQRLKEIKTYYAGRREWKGSDNWFCKHKGIEEIEVYSLDYRNIPRADIYIATGVETSHYVKDYPNKKYYFIQGYENWARPEKE